MNRLNCSYDNEVQARFTVRQIEQIRSVMYEPDHGVLFAAMLYSTDKMNYLVPFIGVLYQD